jgi:hypothetical protein
MFQLVSRSRHPVSKFLHSPPTYTRRAIHASSSRRGGIFRNAEGRWSTSIGTIGTFTLRDIFAILSSLFASEYTAKPTCAHLNPCYHTSLCVVRDAGGEEKMPRIRGTRVQFSGSRNSGEATCDHSFDCGKRMPTTKRGKSGTGRRTLKRDRSQAQGRDVESTRTTREVLE